MSRNIALSLLAGLFVATPALAQTYEVSMLVSDVAPDPSSDSASTGDSLATFDPPPEFAVWMTEVAAVATMATDSNLQNEVVGQSMSEAGRSFAFYWDEGSGMVDLNDEIDPNSGWELTIASTIDDDGIITGVGTLNGQARQYKLVPASAAREQDNPAPAAGVSGMCGATGDGAAAMMLFLGGWSVFRRRGAQGQ
jgi:hypothetical protein